MRNTKNDLIIDISKLILKAANESNELWNYAGYVFETEDGENSTGSVFSFKNGIRQRMSIYENIELLTDKFKELRKLTLVEGDNYWIKCNLIVRKSDGKMKMLFEFDDWSKWKVTPGNFDRAYEVLVGDLFSEILKG